MAEDNPQDVFLLKEAFAAESLDVGLDCIQDGDELLTRLRSLHAESPQSYGLLVLDAHLPRRNAEEVLLLLRKEQKPLPFPVLVLTTLLSEHDKARLLALGVREVLSKPLDLNEYFSLARRLNSMLVGNV